MNVWICRNAISLQLRLLRCASVGMTELRLRCKGPKRSRSKHPAINHK